MPTRRRTVTALFAGLSACCAGCLDGESDQDEQPADDETGNATDGGGGADEPPEDTTMQLDAPDIDDGESIPTEYTCDGADVSPQLEVDGVPDDAAALAIVVDDPDAPAGVFTHWTLWNLPPATTEVPRGVPPEPEPADLEGARQGENDFGAVGYRGPCPPEGDGPHEYRFTLYALESELALEGGATVDEATDAIDDESTASTTLAATYER